MNNDARDKLTDWLGKALGGPVAILSMERLTGGAIQENWLTEIEAGDQRRGIVIRKDAAATIATSHSRRDEFALLKLAHQSGIMVPEPLAFCDDPAVLGGPFTVMAKVAGTGFGPKIVKDETFGGDRETLTHEIGRQMGLIHRLRPQGAAFAFLGEAPKHPLAADIAWLRAALDRLGIARPALEWGLAVLAEAAPPRGEVTLVHRDLRMGNVMVDAQGLTAILDWEFAGWGDPMSDLGWFCARCWRFSRPDREAGGIGSRAAFYSGYAETAEREVDDRAVRLWEIMAHMRWAVIALQQAARHTSGQEPSLELALIGRIAPELELEVLRQTAPPNAPNTLFTPLPSPQSAILAGEPDGSNLLAAGLDLLDTDLVPALSGKSRFHAAMLASAMRMAQREAALLPALGEAQQTLWRETGSADDAALVSVIRSGQPRNAALHAHLTRITRLATAITRPSALKSDERAAIALPEGRLFA